LARYVSLKRGKKNEHFGIAKLYFMVLIVIRATEQALKDGQGLRVTREAAKTG
jgi:hypothetical protein